jgi:YhcH/YjgK/YiaL family protein
MIIDRLENAHLYQNLESGIVRALDFLRTTDLEKLPDGKVEIDGDRLFAMVFRGRTKSPSQAIWESHRKYLDVQYIARGAERMGWVSLSKDLAVTQAYDAEKDVALYAAEGDHIHIAAGTFVVFAPQDVHAPGIVTGRPPVPGEVLKIVVKVAVN